MAVQDFRSAKPQHLRTAYLDPTTGAGRALTIYSGELTVGHGAGHDRHEFAIEYPVLGMFAGTAGKLFPGIIPCGGSSNNRAVFQSAIAMAALSDIVDKTDEAIWDITNVRADLCEVELNPSPATPPLKPLKILAVVLRADVSAQNSEIAHIQYHVTVLSGLIEVVISPDNPGTKNGIEPPHLVGNPDWDGTYQKIGKVLVVGVGNE